MNWFQKPRYRRFHYTPKYVVPDRQERLKISEKSRYHRHSAFRNPFFYVILLIAFFLIFFYLKSGDIFSPGVDELIISSEDAARAPVDTVITLP